MNPASFTSEIEMPVPPARFTTSGCRIKPQMAAITWDLWQRPSTALKHTFSGAVFLLVYRMLFLVVKKGRRLSIFEAIAIIRVDTTYLSRRLLTVRKEFMVFIWKQDQKNMVKPGYVAISWISLLSFMRLPRTAQQPTLTLKPYRVNSIPMNLVQAGRAPRRNVLKPLAQGYMEKPFWITKVISNSGFFEYCEASLLMTHFRMRLLDVSSLKIQKGSNLSEKQQFGSEFCY